MSIRETVEEIRAPLRGPKCRAGLALNPEQVQELHELRGEGVPLSVLCEALERSGIHVEPNNLSRHLRAGKPNGCKCD